MKFPHQLLILVFSITSGKVFCQDPLTVKAYIATYKDLAISEMQRTGIPASIKLAQGIYETGAGTSKLVLKSNNHFGIKCKSNWTGPSVSHDDDARGECFRKYPSPEDSYRDHSDFLKFGARYASLFKLDPSDYTGWANGLKNAGYATNPKYPQALIKVIEDYNLQEYTLIALGKTSVEGAAPQDSNEQSVTVTQTDYPSGVFLINETKVIYAKAGESYLAIAQQNGVDLPRLFDFNEMAVTEMVEKDRLIYLQRKRKSGKEEIHVVLPGESLADIAQTEAIRLESLQGFNYLSSGQQPAAGEKLYLKKKAPAMPRLTMKTDYSLTPDKKVSPGQNN